MCDIQLLVSTVL